MKEIEVKAKITNIENLSEKLANLGCQFGESLTQEDVIFLPIGVEFSEIVKGTPVVRVRNSNDVITLTLKKRVISENELIKLEKEVVVSDKQKAIEIVEHMGFHEVVRVEKTRTECEYEEMTICIDNIVGLGDFIEVEKLSENEKEEEIQDYLFNFLQSLGINNENRVAKGYDTLIYEKSVESVRHE
jgi:adenylate cyclase class 2